jgi:probable F420-dependent oxidoreductase
VKYAITHPMLSHPYDPEIVSGAGVARVAAAAEAAGFSGYGFTDHPAPSQRWLDSGGHDALDPFVAMAFAAATTTTLRLVPNIVVLPYRNPLLVAKAGATLDLLSSGRFTLAVGAGYHKREFRALGVDYDERNALFDEALAVIRSVWTSDEVSFVGRHFEARGITANPRPASDPHPPIWIGGNAAAARQRVADHGDGWCPFAAPTGFAQGVGTVPMDTLELLAEGIGDVRRRVEAAGRDPDSVDVAFTNHVGGSPGSDDFDVEAHVAQTERLAALGVTWMQVNMPGDGLERLLDAIGRYGELVIGERTAVAEGDRAPA